MTRAKIETNLVGRTIRFHTVPDDAERADLRQVQLTAGLDQIDAERMMLRPDRPAGFPFHLAGERAEIVAVYLRDGCVALTVECEGELIEVFRGAPWYRVESRPT